MRGPHVLHYDKTKPLPPNELNQLAILKLNEARGKNKFANHLERASQLLMHNPATTPAYKPRTRGRPGPSGCPVSKIPHSSPFIQGPNYGAHQPLPYPPQYHNAVSPFTRVLPATMPLGGYLDPLVAKKVRDELTKGYALLSGEVPQTQRGEGRRRKKGGNADPTRLSEQQLHELAMMESEGRPLVNEPPDFLVHEQPDYSVEHHALPMKYEEHGKTRAAGLHRRKQKGAAIQPGNQSAAKQGHAGLAFGTKGNNLFQGGARGRARPRDAKGRFVKC